MALGPREGHIVVAFVLGPFVSFDGYLGWH